MFCSILEYDVMNGVQFLLSDARGVYIPRDFIDNFNLDKWHIDTKYVHLLSSPDNVVLATTHVENLQTRFYRFVHIVLQDGQND